jgi:hypothetical protein
MLKTQFTKIGPSDSFCGVGSQLLMKEGLSQIMAHITIMKENVLTPIVICEN